MHVRLRHPAVRFGASLDLILIMVLAAMGLAPEERRALAWQPMATRQSAPTDAKPGDTTSRTSAATSQANADANAKTFYTRHRRFGLPITVLQAPYQIRSVQLHVSVDGGTTWRTYAEEPASRSEFIFDAPSDGQYWFASKTVDVQNAVRPTGRTRAEQHVIIDTQKPQFDLRADVTAHGTIRISWRVSDANLDPTSLLIEYQAPPRDDWTPIEVPSELLVSQRGVMAGEFEWRPTVSSRVVFLGSRIKDKAGNVAVESTRVFLPRVASRTNIPSQNMDGVARSTAPPADADVGGELTPETYALRGDSTRSRGMDDRLPGTVPWPADDETERGSAPPTGSEPSERDPNTPRDPLATMASRGRPPEAQGWTGSEPGAGVSGDVRPQVAAQVPSAGALLASSPNSASPSDVSEASEASEASGTSGTEVEGAPEDEPAGMASEPAGDDGTGSAGERDAWPEIPAGESLRMTRSRRFFLEYDIESAGPEGVAEVELWATQDGGRTWEKWGVDADKQSPLDVQVDEEGVYGFRVVVVGKNGLAAPSPAPGDAADLWVGVDMTPPEAEITAVTYGTGARIGDLDIRWIASDRRLTARPITLTFSASREGPWTTIASGLPNSGQYFWKVDASVPKQVYLRIQCQDEAGNATEFVIREPINTERLSPKGRIRGFRPAEEEEAAAKSAFFWFPWR